MHKYSEKKQTDSFMDYLFLQISTGVLLMEAKKRIDLSPILTVLHREESCIAIADGERHLASLLETYDVRF